MLAVDVEVLEGRSVVAGRDRGPGRDFEPRRPPEGGGRRCSRITRPSGIVGRTGSSDIR